MSPVHSATWSDPASNFWQWFNIAAGFIGLIASIFSWYQSSRAAKNAIDAKTAARSARDAVLDNVRHEKLAELGRDLEDLHHLITLPELLSKKCTKIRATVMIFKREVGKQLDGSCLAQLDAAREQLSLIIEAAYNPKNLTDQNRAYRLVSAFGEVAEAIGDVRAAMGLQLAENEK